MVDDDTSDDGVLEFRELFSTMSEEEVRLWARALLPNVGERLQFDELTRAATKAEVDLVAVHRPRQDPWDMSEPTDSPEPEDEGVLRIFYWWDDEAGDEGSNGRAVRRLGRAYRRALAQVFGGSFRSASGSQSGLKESS